jgi:serine/threonine protein kinase
MNYNGSGSLVNSVVNSAYCRKANGVMSNGPGSQLTGSYEMNTLLQQHEQNQAYSAAYFAQSQHQYSPHTEPPAEPYQISSIPQEQLLFGKVAGEDPLALLYLGELRNGRMANSVLQVMIKTLKPRASQIEVSNFRDEVMSVATLNHPHLLRLLGISYLDNNPTNFAAVFEYQVHGDLRNFLKVREPATAQEDQEERARNFDDFLRIASQIAFGMEYLANAGHIHRDLATRNCLVGDQQVIKIANFGHMKQCYDNDYVKMPARGRLPVRWMSKEILNGGQYSEASDVYAFGVTLWEMYTFGRQPYEDCTNEDVIEMIREHIVLDSPQNCPSNIYATMVECWNDRPERRPTFSELHLRLQEWCTTMPRTLQSLQNRAGSVHSGIDEVKLFN